MRSNTNAPSTPENPYDYYLLANNNPETIAAAINAVGTGSAVLYYPPDESSSSSNSSIKYYCFYIDKGEKRKSKDKYVGDLSVSATIPDGKCFVKFSPKDGKQNQKNDGSQSLQKPVDTDVSEVEKIEAPIDIVNIMVEYAKDDDAKNTQELTSAIPSVDSSSSISSSSSSSSSSPELEQSPVVGVTSYVSPRSHGNVPLVSTLFNAIKAQQLRALLTAIVSGEPDKVKAMLDKDPSLLYEELEGEQFVTDPAGYKYNLKPYQAAESVNDTQMAKLIKSYFKDEKEAKRQYDEQYPEGWEKAEAKKWQPIFEQLHKLTLAIRDSKKDDITSSGHPGYIITVKEGSPVKRELDKFWRLLDATKNEVIHAGNRPFNHDLLLNAWQTYDNDKSYQECFGGRWDNPRALLFWQKVIGYDGIQRCMPVNYVQAFQDWLEDTVKKLRNDEPQARGTQFRIYRASTNNWEPVNFYPLLPRGSSDFNFAIYGAGCAGGGRSGGWGICSRFEAYVNQKQLAHRAYTAQRPAC